MADDITLTETTIEHNDEESPVVQWTEHVQIKADKKEIQRRIAAFIARKRKEADELNIQEFCNLPRAEMASEFSCARVDAVMVHRAGCKGHVKVSRAINQWGPQTIPSNLAEITDSKSANNCDNSSSYLPEGIEERLRNMETHLDLKPGNPVPRDIYERLKNLEDRILFLESLSPDYFVNLPRKLFKSDKLSEQSMTSVDKGSRISQDLTLDEINERIGILRENLLSRSMAVP